MLSLGGIPATAGFLGKWFVFGVLVREGWIAAAVVGALLSVIALGYYLRVIVVLYMQPALEGVEPPARSPWSVSAAGAVCAAFVLAMGLLPSWFLHLLD
jgi:NADH-quinone oxidoreductase subunit N